MENGNKRRIVVIGNGMVGLRFCERLTEYDSARQYEVITVGEECRPAYDRVQLTKFFETRDPDALCMAPAEWYARNGISLTLNERVTHIDRARSVIVTHANREIPYDTAILATGSGAFVPPIPGIGKQGVFVYRTIEDLQAIIDYAKTCKRAAVIGGGLLGLEAAKAVLDLGLETHVVEFASRLMPRQLDDAGATVLADKIRAMGVEIHVNRNTAEILGESAVTGLLYKDGEQLDVDMVVVSAGIRPRDEVARESGIKVGARGGVVVDDDLRTNDPNIFAIGECALHGSMIYGLVAPGYEMADAVARTLTGTPTQFSGADMSTKLKLLGVDVASFGDSLSTSKRTIVLEDRVKGIYKKLVLSEDCGRLLGGCLVGDAKEYAQLLHLTKSEAVLPPTPEDLILGSRDGSSGGGEMPDDMQICSCNNVVKGTVCKAILEDGITCLSDLKAKTKAGTGCGGCMPEVTDLFNIQLAKLGKATKPVLCEHFAYTRQELYEIIKVKKYKSFDDVIAGHGSGQGCEICKPTVASILASVVNDLIVQHDHLQDTNDRFLANIQRQGLYSVVPRVPGGEITPEKLIVLGLVAKKYNLYTKITGGQRVDLFGARVNDLPNIWEELIAAGFESGHAYGKALRTVKSCVGSTWCRYGVQDSVGMAIRLENRYKGIRSPHKLKSAVSGCIRECAEAQSKDFSLIATEKGYNVYVCGNGGSKPRHADLLIADVSAEDAVRYLDRFIMYYIRTADKLTRTSVWLEKLEGGIEHVRQVILEDSLGIATDLEREMQYLVDTYQCEWKSVVERPELRAKFRHYANSEEGDATVDWVPEREMRRPSDWTNGVNGYHPPKLPVPDTSWVKVARVADFPKDAGMTIKYGNAQIAVFNFSSRGEWYAVQNECPHRHDMVLSRGIIGDQKGTPKVACPLHKKTFSLKDGQCLTGEDYELATFPVKIVDGTVWLELPATEHVEKLIGAERLRHSAQCTRHEAPLTELRL